MKHMASRVQVSQEGNLAGRAGYYGLLQQQTLLFPSENALVQIDLNRYLEIVQLYRALRGGFQRLMRIARPPETHWNQAMNRLAGRLDGRTAMPAMHPDLSGCPLLA